MSFPAWTSLALGAGAEAAAAPAAALTLKYALWAAALGALAASSLPLGSALGLIWKPRSGWTAAQTAFGAGALLAALSLELVAPTALGMLESGAHNPQTGSSGTEPVTALAALLAGGVAGGLLFVLLDQIVNAHGGYLRKTATTITYLSKRRKLRIEHMLERLGQIDFLRRLPPEHINQLVDYVRPVTFQKGEKIFDQGDIGHCMYFVEQGEIDLFKQGAKFRTLQGPDILGEIALLTEGPRTAGAVARTTVTAIELSKEDFDHVRKLSPELEAAMSELATQRIEDLIAHDQKALQASLEWAKQAAEALRTGATVPTPQEVRDAAREHKGAGLAIWLGTFLDNIPESFVLGTTFLALVSAQVAQRPPAFIEVIPYTLVSALFLSNLPEALSSTIGMQRQGWQPSRIILLWFSLVLIGATSALIGFTAGTEVGPGLVAAIQGLAAGAMLTMIAQAMLPEAVHLGGTSIVGISTLAGFLAAVAFKILEM